VILAHCFSVEKSNQIKMRNALLFLIMVFNVSVCSAQSGALDTTFGTNGHTIFNFSSSTHDYTSAMAIQGDGKIVLAGSKESTVTSDFAIARANSDGAPDLSFGVAGKISMRLDTLDSYVRAIAFQNGKIIIAGSAGNGYASAILLIRLNPNGTFDSTFDSDGIVTTFWGSDRSGASCVSVQPDGKLVVGGACETPGGNSRFAIFRFNSDGSLDSTFGSNGRIITGIPGAYAGARCVVTQDDGKILLGGTVGSSQARNNFILMRCSGEGTIDSTFGLNGIVVADFYHNDDNLGSIVIQEDGKILVCGTSDSLNYGWSLAMSRYLQNGTLDNTFGNAGQIKLAADTARTCGGAVLVQSDHKILVAGSLNYRNAPFNPAAMMIKSSTAVFRFNGDGSLDNTFGVNGFQVTDLGFDSESPCAIAMQSNDKIVVAGTTFHDYHHYFGHDNDMFILRYNNSILAGLDGDSSQNSFPEIGIFPNPSSGMLTVRTNNIIKKEIQIYDLLGNRVAIMENVTQYNLEIDLSNQPKGIYFLEIETNKEKVVKKIVLQ
jgi:uncharacterized delta-60 repeat protein